MKINILLITLGIISLMGMVSAVYPGETITVNNTLQTTDLDYLIVDNSTAIENLEFNITNEEINITLPQDIPPISFIIVFIHDEDTQTVIVQQGSSGGGSYSHHNNIIKQNNTNQTNCLTGKKMCSGDFVYTCDGISWVLTEECSYGCVDDKCSTEPVGETTPEKSNKKPSTLLIIIVLSILAVFFIIYILLKLKIIKIKKVD